MAVAFMTTMSSYLLDTHVAIFALQTPEKLSVAARNALLSEECFLSVVSYWEVMIKTMKGAMDIGNPRTWWVDTLDQLTAAQLLLRPQHISALHSLPPHHKDPFDRILIAQAIAEDLTLISTDKSVQRYSEASLRVIS
ncbi:type II toxin-antitoxin system VapC family toxin [Terracidiphilus sp.]|uniref:type II toxin-antitoxin system VapC family toxin n=1 Tax=Terracidiphilus sp. TaxID=1964191 RepID=UPI003C26E792